MSGRRAFKAQASSSKAAFGQVSASFGADASGHASPFTSVSPSALSYVYEPPDLSGISDPVVVVALKNLQKKDSTTKAKALEDLEAFVLPIKDSSHDGVENAVLEAWSSLYPRVSIDSSRRVRQLAHTLQGLIAAACGRRVAKYMPVTVGAWLCGQHDNDKAVARAASESFTRVFATPEKQTGVWKAYGRSVFAYCKSAILHESSRTLSDERTVSPDDAESKYCRTVATALCALLRALEMLPLEDASHNESFLEIIRAEHTWRFVSSSDAYLRRAICCFLIVAGEQIDQLLDMHAIRTCFIREGLQADQRGSMKDFLRALISLTKNHADVWDMTISSSSKKSPLRDLNRFLRKGSQSGPADIWAQVAKLLRLIPPSTLQSDTKGEDEDEDTDTQSQRTSQVLSALRRGIVRKEEPAVNQNEGLICYLETAEHLAASFSDLDARRLQHHDNLLPLLSKLLGLQTANSLWPLKSHEFTKPFVQAVLMLVPDGTDALADILTESSAALIESIQISQPAQSRDYVQSQDRIVASATRWYDLQQAVLKSSTEPKLHQAFAHLNKAQISASVDLLNAREGKPYSAAALIASAVEKCPSTTTEVPGIKAEVLRFIQDTLPPLIASPAGPFLLRLLTFLGWSDESRAVYTRGLEHVALLHAVEQECDREDATVERWSLMGLTLRNPGLPEASAFLVLSKMSDGLPTISNATAILRTVEGALSERIPAIASYLASSQSAKFISLTISFAESSVEEEDILELDAKEAAESLLANPAFLTQTSTSLIDAIRNEVTSATELSLPMDSVVNQAIRLLQNDVQDRGKLAVALLPVLETWPMILKPYLNTPLDPSLTLTNELGGLLYLIQQKDESADATVDTVATDAEGHSIAYRAVYYSVKLIKETGIFSVLTDQQRALIFQLIALFNQIASDHLAVSPSHAIWGPASTSSPPSQEVIEFVAEAQAEVATWIRGNAECGRQFVDIALKTMEAQIGEMTIVAYYNARACDYAVSELRETSSAGPSPAFGSMFASMRISTGSEDPLQQCNQLMSVLTGLSEDTFVSEPEKVLRDLVASNKLLGYDLAMLGRIPQRRRVLLMQNMVANLGSDGVTQPVIAETLKLIMALIPGLIEIYGEFWETLLDLILGHLNASASSLPTLHVSLRLCATIRFLLKEGATEDLQEAWDERQSRLGQSLFGLMKSQSALPDANHQPRKMVNDLLTRQVAASEKAMPHSVDDVLPVMSSETVSIQRAAYQILHRNIPRAQEAISIEAVLSKDQNVKLSNELLAYIQEKPTEPPKELGTASDMPSSLARYLLCWKLVFDHWTNASYKVQSDYVSCVKERDYIDKLLDLVFRCLTGPRGPHQIISPSKFNIEVYLPGHAETPKADVQHLLAHIYYLSLKHLPHLVKAWWRTVCPRPLEKPVEDWTEKHISPLVVRDELNAVAAWDPNPEADPGDPALEIKTSPRAREVVASYPVDETFMAIRVALPAAYPLQPIDFTTVRRVAVDERRWSAWLNTSQIVANFASTSQGLGCVVDGLAVWRRNVVGAMKSQSECAICYSVVSPDKMLPTKRCGTCKNVFHGHCLFRWFKSSSTSGCPLCRNPFHYG